MADAPDDLVKILMDGSGKMTWDVPHKESVPRTQVYQLLGMVTYARQVLLDMLKQPITPPTSKQ